MASTRGSKSSDHVLWISFLAIVGVLICIESDGLLLLRCLGQSILVFAIFAFLVYQCDKLRRHCRDKNKNQDEREDVMDADGYSRREEELREMEQEARERIQHEYTQQAHDYEERIQKPKEEASRRRQEQKYARLMGPNWKGIGKKLGRLELPCEPAEEDPAAVAIRVRTLAGNIHKRRFLTDHTIQVLLDYMTTLGYHSQLYTLATTYPRQTLSPVSGRTLRDVGITTATSLNIELIESEDSDND